MRLSARLFALAPRLRWQLAGQVALLLCITATYVGQGILVARVLAGVIGGRDLASVLPLVAGVVVLVGVRMALLRARETTAVAVSGSVKEAVRQRLAASLLRLGPGWLQRTRTGATQSALVDGVEKLDPYVGQFLPRSIAAVIAAPAVTAYVIVLDPLVGLIVLGCGLLAPVAPWLSRRFWQGQEWAKAWWLRYRGLYAENLDAVQGMATLKAFNAGRRRGEELRAEAEAFCIDSIRICLVTIYNGGAVALLVATGTAVAVGVGALRLTSGALSAVELFTVLLLVRECFRPLHDLQTAYHASYSAWSAAPGIFELIDAEPDVAEPADPVPASRVARPPALSFQDVSFCYDGRPRPALDGFSLSIAAGQRVALVGRSGAGKTTVVSLLLRCFELQGGRILVDGCPIGDLALDGLRSLVAVVAQDSYLFHDTVRRNITLARPDATDAELEAAARAAGAHDFIRALPRGYETVVGERGLKLSGGQRQRVAIARALLEDAPILVLDEATSSVDAASESLIQQALDTLTRGRTTLVIAHRLSTVRNADKVVVLDAGRVVEVGDHAELLARQGAYARLVAAQGAGGRPPGGQAGSPGEGSP